MKKILRRLLLFLYHIKSLFIELFSNDYIVLSTSVKPLRYNWGDDVSQRIVQLINPTKRLLVRHYSWNIKKKDDILCIGSIISWMTTPSSIIWGSGVVYPDRPISSKPKEVLAVRGPLTRDYLLKQGISCPEIYGDPALLFPMYYTPSKQKIYKLGIIPHFRDQKNKYLQKFYKQKDVLIIDVHNINPWHKFIDDICSCESIVSSSLHGIIISDAYSVPNAWIEFDGGEQKRFAFLDYFASVKRKPNEPSLIINESTSQDDLSTISKEFEPIDIDLNKLLNVCPFNK